MNWDGEQWLSVHGNDQLLGFIISFPQVCCSNDISSNNCSSSTTTTTTMIIIISCLQWIFLCPYFLLSPMKHTETTSLSLKIGVRTTYVLPSLDTTFVGFHWVPVVAFEVQGWLADVILHTQGFSSSGKWEEEEIHMWPNKKGERMCSTMLKVGLKHKSCSLCNLGVNSSRYLMAYYMF